MTELAFQRLDERARVPTRAHEGDAGLDLAAVEGGSLAPGERLLVGTGLAVAIPAGHAGLVLPRSGLASRHGITVANAPGLVDAGYRGELKVILVNLDRRESFAFEAGERIAQLVVVKVALPGAVEVEELEGGVRGPAGFGSSGRT